MCGVNYRITRTQKHGVVTVLTSSVVLKESPALTQLNQRQQNWSALTKIHTPPPKEETLFFIYLNNILSKLLFFLFIFIKCF